MLSLLVITSRRRWKVQSQTKYLKQTKPNSTLLWGKDLSYRATGQFWGAFLVASSKHLLATFWKEHSFDYIELSTWKAQVNPKTIPVLETVQSSANGNCQEWTLPTRCGCFTPRCIFLTVLQNSLRTLLHLLTTEPLNTRTQVTKEHRKRFKGAEEHLKTISKTRNAYTFSSFN